MFEPIDRVMNMRKGGSAVAPRRTVIGGQDHMLSYITPQEGEILMSLGGSGNPGPMGIPSFENGDGYVDPVTSYLVPLSTNVAEPEYRRVRIGSAQDTMANRAAGSASLSNQLQGTSVGVLPVDIPPEVAARINPNYAAAQAALAAKRTATQPDPVVPDPVVPDPVVSTEPSGIVVDPVEVVAELGNIPTFN